VQNLAPGAADRLGTASQVLRGRHPRLIVCNVSGYGTSGPYAQKKAYDLFVQSEAGLTSITGSEDAPARHLDADIAAGVCAYSGGAFSRAHGGRGPRSTCRCSTRSPVDGTGELRRLR
jgi:crotonobetainyl-CoA:carnitine CoA-transferase CaiB-like acyl-CoA transferase